ncbi:MAG: hypothetical protein Q4C96_00485 [Planctomycetia bacterium]|nr:hypothetical protein [Planctomycetia bacterium]
MNENGDSAKTENEMMDPRYRQRILMNTLDVMQKLADTPSPWECRQTLILSVDQLNSWLQAEAVPAGWTVDTAVEKWANIFDLFDAVRVPQEKVIQSLKYPVEYPLKVENLVIICRKYNEISQKITPDFPPVMQALKGYLEAHSRQLLVFLQKKMQLSSEESAQLLKMLEDSDLITKRLGVLYGTGRHEFLSGALLVPDDDSHPLAKTFLMDSGILFENFLFRDVSRWAQGTATNAVRNKNVEMSGISDVSGDGNEIIISAYDLDRVAAIFDWVTINIALLPDDVMPALQDLAGAVPTRLPVEVLLTGRGTAVERAWVFMLLARQQGLNVILIRFPALLEGENAQNNSEKARQTVYRYLVGYAAPDAVYLFDPELGIPVPAEGIKGLKNKDHAKKTQTETAFPASSREIENGMLKMRPATWRQLCENPEILEEIMQELGLPLKLTPEMMRESVAFVEVMPAQVSLRMRILQTQLTGKDRVVLVWEPTVLMEDLRKRSIFAAVETWTYPYEVLVYRAMNLSQAKIDELRCMLPLEQNVMGSLPLWRGRMLHLKGILTGPLSATYYYQKSRLSDQDIQRITRSTELPSEEAKEYFDRFLENLRYVRLTASYYMATILQSVKNAAAAEEYYQAHVLTVSPEINPWASGAYYGMGRLKELQGNAAEAIKIYEKKPEYLGCKARIILLKQLLEESGSGTERVDSESMRESVSGEKTES